MELDPLTRVMVVGRIVALAGSVHQVMVSAAVTVWSLPRAMATPPTVMLVAVPRACALPVVTPPSVETVYVMPVVPVVPPAGNVMTTSSPSVGVPLAVAVKLLEEFAVMTGVEMTAAIADTGTRTKTLCTGVLPAW